MSLSYLAPRAQPLYSILALSTFICFSNEASAQEPSEQPAIVVSAARSEQIVTDALNHTTVIDRNTIDKSPASDVVSLLKMQSGLSITQNGTQGSLTGVRIRGGEPRHTLILLDGVPMNNLSSGFPALEQIPLSSIEKIEVVRGNVSALHGSQAVGGLIQIFTRRPNGNDATIRIAGGDRGQRQASVQVRGGNEKIQATFGISHDQTRAISTQNAQDTARINPFSTINPDKDGYKNSSANGLIRYRPSDNHEFGLNFLESRGENNYDNDFGSSDEAIQYNKTRVQNINLYANNQLTKNWKSYLRLSQYTDRSDDFDRPSLFGSGESRFQTRTQEASWQNDIHTRFGELIVGASHTYQKLSASNVQYDHNKRDTNSVWAGYNLDKARHHLQLNVRTDRLSDIGRENTAAINYGYDVADKVRVFGGYSNGFSAPNFNELFYPKFSNPNLKAEHATYAQLGAQYADEHFGGRLTLFETRYRDKITFDSTFIPVNLNRAKARGIEWHGWYNAYDWSLESSLTYQDVKDNATGERLIRQPRVLATLGVGKRWGRWNAQFNWQAQGDITDISDTKVAGYGVANIALSYAPVNNVKIGLSLGNIFNRHYQTVYSYNSMPRNVLLSVQYQPKW